MAEAEAVDKGLEDKFRKVHWVPLESNPEMLTSFARKVGVPAAWEFIDVWGMDQDVLSFMPKTCVAVTLLFGCSDNIKKYAREQRARIEKDGQTVSANVRFVKQYVGNACGTIATLHCLANNASVIGFPAGTPLSRFLESISGKSPQEAGLMLADAEDLHAASETSAQGGQTAAPEAEAAVDAHFVAFIEKDGDLYELDGAKPFPINHGKTEGGLLSAACKTIRAKFMDTDPQSTTFNLMALVKPD